jgi:hypothetical protein
MAGTSKKTSRSRAGKRKKPVGPAPLLSLRPAFSAVVQLAVLSAALYVILSAPHEDSTIKWAFGVVGMLLGQRLRT